MKTAFRISDFGFRIDRKGGKLSRSAIRNPQSAFRNCIAFTLIEVLVAVTLLSLIVIALMAVFNGTQTAFRAGLTQTDVLESGRATMDLIAADLRQMSPSNGTNDGAMNFCVTNYVNQLPFYQQLLPSSNARANVQENFFILSSGNQNGVPTWFGVGYAVVANAPNGSLYSLYRFSANHPMAMAGEPGNLFNIEFQNFLASPTNYGHLMDGVVGLRVHAYDLNGVLISTNVPGSVMRTNPLPNIPGEAGYVFYSNAVPASVEIEMAAVEDRALQRAGSFGSYQGATNYLSRPDQSGKVHIFRQRVSIPNVDPSAYP